MTYFYYNSETNREISDRVTTLDEALVAFYELPDETDSFFGLENKSNQIIQFVWQTDDQWLIDMPTVDTVGTYQGIGTFDDCSAVIIAFFDNKDIRQIFSLNYVSLI
jgi:hypothetical protein